MIEVSERILALQKLPPKNSSIENFTELETLGVIKSYDKYAEMIRLKNKSKILVSLRLCERKSSSLCKFHVFNINTGKTEE